MAARGTRKTWILTALGKDRPGIVAEVTKRLYALGGNLQDSAMSRLGGEFVIMLVFSTAARVTHAKLAQMFQALERSHGLTIHIKSLAASELRAHAQGRPYVISVYGADHPGIVYRVSALLATLRVNITDVATHLASQRSARPVYLMLLEVECPSQVPVARLERALHTLAKRLRVDVTVRAADSAVL